VSGWYPDPTGRFEYRYHNDREWTADVASGGRRFVDPLPATPAPAEPGGNGLAVAGMVCGVVAVVIAWVPFVAVLGLITALVGLALSIPGLARSRRTGSRRAFAIAGIITSACALVLGVLGVVLTVALVRAIDRFDDPGPYDARLTACTAEGREIVATGQVENLGNDTQTYSVLVRLSPDAVERVVVEDVPAGATADFEARERAAVDDEPDCRILAVDGPPPFGLDPELFE
jgi:hypothetical protein